MAGEVLTKLTDFLVRKRFLVAVLAVLVIAGGLVMMRLGASDLDLIPVRKTGWRKLVAFRAVSQKKIEGVLSQEEYISRWSAIQKEAARSNDMSVRTAALWKMESLGVTYGKLAGPTSTLNDPRVPVEVRPVIHVGMGGGVTEVCNFDPGKITSMIERLSNPDYHWFPYEQQGAMLGVYEKSLPRIMLGLKALDRPDPAQFINSFPPEAQRLISHGYGRLIYFNSMNLATAFQNIVKRPFLQVPAAVQGMAFGYAMVNHLDLKLLLETGDRFQDPGLARAFNNGLIYALMFWEWETPGFLKSLQASDTRQAGLIRIAQQQVDSGRARGALPAFHVEKY